MAGVRKWLMFQKIQSKVLNFDRISLFADNLKWRVI